MCSQFTLHDKFRIDGGRTKFWQGQTNGKDWSSIKQNRTQLFFTIYSQLVVSRKQFWWNLEKSYTRKYMCHLDQRRRFPVKIIGRATWILVAKNSKDIHRIELKTQYTTTKYRETCYQMERRNFGTHQVWSRMIMSQIQRVRRKPYADMNPQNVACWLPNILEMIKQVRCGETRHGGSKRGTQNCFQSTRTVKLSCKGSRTHPSSKAYKKDRKSSSSRSTSSQLAED